MNYKRLRRKRARARARISRRAAARRKSWTQRIITKIHVQIMDKLSENTATSNHHHHHHHHHHQHHHLQHTHEILDAATTNPQTTQRKRKEKARIAARARRSQEANIITEMAKELHITRRIDKATIVKLAIDYIKAFEILCRFRHEPESLGEIGNGDSLSSGSIKMSNSDSSSSSSSSSVSGDSGISNCNSNCSSVISNSNSNSRSNSSSSSSDSIESDLISSKNTTTTTTTTNTTTTPMTTTNQRRKASISVYCSNNENNNNNINSNSSNNNNTSVKRESREQQRQQQQQINQPSPKLNTTSIFAPKTNEINSYFLMIGDVGFIFKSDTDILEEDDLTHLAPQAGDTSISLEADPLDDIVIDPELFENEIVK